MVRSSNSALRPHMASTDNASVAPTGSAVARAAANSWSASVVAPRRALRPGWSAITSAVAIRSCRSDGGELNVGGLHPRPVRAAAERAAPGRAELGQPTAALLLPDQQVAIRPGR